MNEQTIKLFSSKKTDCWRTPTELYEQLDKEFNFNLDPCPIDPTFDGLEIDWVGNIYVNPPYSQVEKWLEKAHKELKKQAKTIVFLTFANTDTKWFHDHVLGKAEIRFIKGRLKFLNKQGERESSAMRPSILIIFKHLENSQ